MKDDKQQEQEAEEIVEEQTEPDEIAELQQIADAWEGKYKRALADYQNLQKRVNEEKGDWIRSANKDLLLRLLPVLDTLMLAAAHSKDQGLAVTINQFLDTVKAEGVTKIETIGKKFDPMLMECVTTEVGEADKVITELRTGYQMHDKVLRAAQVVVGRKE